MINAGLTFEQERDRVQRRKVYRQVVGELGAESVGREGRIGPVAKSSRDLR
jgi:hypothetical protein